MNAQSGLCRTWWEIRRPVFSRCGSHKIQTHTWRERENLNKWFENGVYDLLFSKCTVLTNEMPSLFSRYNNKFRDPLKKKKKGNILETPRGDNLLIFLFSVKGLGKGQDDSR